ncbi:MAG TPA: hypothetical protein VK973_10620 [Arenicellales bacterium]|nr:hypothetical protein [Arenicellales bacterium]
MRVFRALLLILAIASALGALAVVLGASSGIELGTVWHGVAPESLNLLQAVAQRYVHPALWTHLMLPVLLAPAALILAVVAAAAALLLVAVSLGRPGKRQ